MRQRQRPALPRRSESGALTLVIAICFPVLITFAVLAVDMGYRYTQSRMLQAVADAAVTAGMPSLVNNNATAASTAATNIAQANGYSGGNAVISTSASQLSVTVTKTAPSFFAALVGGSSTRLLSGTAVGVVLGSPGPALLTLGGCASSGLSWSGNGAFQIDGPVESNGPMTFSTGGATVQNFQSSVDSDCAVPSMGSGPITYSGGAPAIGGPYADPFSGVTLATLAPLCTVGNLTSQNDIQTASWTYTGANNIWTLTPGVYCSDQPLTLSGPGTAFIATGVTLISTAEVVVGANNTLAGSSVLTAASGIPENLAIYSGATTVGCAGQAVNLGSMDLTVNGSIYAPNGCANLSGQQGMTINGSVIAQNMIIGASGDWTFNPSGGVATNNWRMLK